MIYIAALENWDDTDGRYITITHSGPHNTVDPIGVAPGQDWVEALADSGWKITSGKRLIRGRTCFTVQRADVRTTSTIDANGVVLGFIGVHEQLTHVARIIVDQDDELMTLRRWFRAVVRGEGGGIPVALMLGVSQEEAQSAHNSLLKAGGFDAVDWDYVERSI